MRLIIEYEHGDGFTYTATRTIPMEYDSAEALAVDFEQAIKDNWGLDWFNRGMVKIGGQEFDSGDFGRYNVRKNTDEYVAPNIYTVDEWFAQHGVE